MPAQRQREADRLGRDVPNAGRMAPALPGARDDTTLALPPTPRAPRASESAQAGRVIADVALRPLPPPTLATLYPPIRGYRYFDAAAAWPFDPGAGPASARNRWWMAEHALLAYDDAAVIDAVLAAQGYRSHCLIDRASSGHAHVALADDHAVLAFRGTEVVTPGDSLLKFADVARDWLIDARFPRVPIPGGGNVHGGFVAALDALWPSLEPLLETPRVWWCCGHSLGGALAALAAVRLQHAKQQVAGVVTFGQPLCGDRAFARRLGALPVMRVVNACDVVARLPPAALGFEHGGDLLHLDAAAFHAYGATVRKHLRGLPAALKHGIGALTPIELIDHAPLHYAIKIHNAVLEVAG